MAFKRGRERIYSQLIYSRLFIHSICLDLQLKLKSSRPAPLHRSWQYIFNIMADVIIEEEEAAPLAVVAAGEKAGWAIDIQSEADQMNTAAESALWQKHSIYRVQACIKDLNPKAYTPQVVSFGPYHHGEGTLAPMEGHKRRSVVHFVQRSRKPFGDFVAAVEEAEQKMIDAYAQLEEGWRKDREGLLRLMMVDGCFMLEVLRTAAAAKPPADYAANDPIFSSHGLLYVVPYIRRDMLMIENQLPLLVLDKLIVVETGRTKNDDYINRLVHRFFAPNEPYISMPLGLHPLDVYRKSLLHHDTVPRSPRKRRKHDDDGTTDIVRSAMELYEAGIRFKKNASSSLHDIRFKHGVLSLPVVVVDDLTEAKLRNFMAFERLHVGAGNEVTSYVFFMDNIIDSAKDVSLLHSRGIIHNAMGSDKAVAKLFNSLSKDVSLDPESSLDEVHRLVNEYCRKSWNMWRANLIHTYFRSPWAFLSLAAAIFLLVLTVAQAVFSVLQWRQGLDNGGGEPSPPPANFISPSPQ